MYDFINTFNAFYTDTDSIFTLKELPSEYVGLKLGQFKLEHKFDEAIFLSPKVYGGINNEYELVKVKGLKNPITFAELKSLTLKNSSLSVNQEKWLRKISHGEIFIKNELYSIMASENKRKLIYKDSQLIDTKPFIIKNGHFI